MIGDGGFTLPKFFGLGFISYDLKWVLHVQTTIFGKVDGDVGVGVIYFNDFFNVYGAFYFILLFIRCMFLLFLGCVTNMLWVHTWALQLSRSRWSVPHGSPKRRCLSFPPFLPPSNISSLCQGLYFFLGSQIQILAYIECSQCIR